MKGHHLQVVQRHRIFLAPLTLSHSSVSDLRVCPQVDNQVERSGVGLGHLPQAVQGQVLAGGQVSQLSAQLYEAESVAVDRPLDDFGLLMLLGGIKQEQITT